MTSKATTELLDSLHGELARQLTARIKSGEATASDLNVARQFLKDNGIDAVPREASPLTELAKSLPFPSAEDFADEDHTLQ
jgi:hypothetical protein